MCGIAGFYAPGEPVEPWFATAIEAARHRGPDGDGAWANGFPGRVPLARVRDGSAPAGHSVALGFLRLSILDLGPTGDQPMVAGRASLAFNGEIYNYVELRDELRSRGWTFDSSGDSQVLLTSWLEWGESMLTRLNGMWAFAIYDAERDGLLLSRDRFGEKPLFWTPWRGGIAFASEVKQLRGFPDLELRLDDRRAAANLRSGRPYDGASSWFAGVHQLEPGSWLWIDRDGIRTGRYFDLATEVAAIERPTSPGAWQERFADAFLDSVRLRLRSDVPVGTSLSGGIDSSAVMAAATHLGHSGYHSFTVTSDDPRIDEGAQASAFATLMGSTWHPIRMDGAEFAAAWDELSWHQECPVASTSLFGQWKVMGAARACGVIVLLDGQGADEILGGYHKFYVAHLLGDVRGLHPRAFRTAWGLARQVGGPRAVVEDGYRYLGRLGRAPRWTDVLTVVPDVVDRAPAVRVPGDAMRIADVERWSLPNLLPYVDRSAMAHGVETRLPFLDPAVAVLSVAMPSDVLIRDGWTKWPLRQTLAMLGGSDPAGRRGKRWFGVPQRAWLRGPLASAVDTWRRAPSPMWDSFTDTAAVRACGDRWLAATRTSPALDDQVFAMVSLDRFFRVWFPD
jgi:asparagine synthase (glutamine-hydrolysing)